jgi:hypothetical protein
MRGSGLARKRAGNSKIGKYPGLTAGVGELEAKKDQGCEKPAQRAAKAAPDWRAADLEPQGEEHVQSGASHAPTLVRLGIS